MKAPMIRKRRVLHGYTFRDPQGRLDCRIVGNVETAQSNAAFASKRPYSHINWPKDWRRAYRQGFRIIKVNLRCEWY